MKRNSSFILKSMFFSLFLLPSTVSAIPIFSQDFDPTMTVSISDSDFGSTSSIQKADNFTLTTDAVLNSISWLGAYRNTNSPLDDADNFTLVIFSNNIPNNLPDALSPPLLNINIGNTDSRVNSGENAGTSNFNIFSYQADLSSDLSLSAGTYWLSIINNTNLGWAWGASSISGDIAFTDSESFWSQSNGTLQFELNTAAVPLPAASWLLASGFLGLLGFKKKKVIS